jgi:hypothetical protein
LQRLEASDREDPFAAVIRCTADAAKADKRTRDKWSLRDAVRGGVQAGFGTAGSVHKAGGRRGLGASEIAEGHQDRRAPVYRVLEVG